MNAIFKDRELETEPENSGDSEPHFRGTMVVRQRRL